jgi:alpha-galactosidase
MIGHTALSSFSDAHELDEIPIIAASLHRLMLPRQSQIWAVLHPSDSDRRLVYSLAATFLGRMCLSGDVLNLSESQWSLAENAMRFYSCAAPIIKEGHSHIVGEIGPSWRYPQGWQGVLRYSSDGQKALVVLHAFAQAPERVEVPLDNGIWRIEAHFDADFAGAIQDENTLNWPIPADFSAAVVLLARDKT